MAFTVFVNSTTAYANEVVDNFYHIFQGHVLPRGGASLEATNAAYDLGSSTYPWYAGYFNTVQYTTCTVNDAIYLLSSIELTVTTASIEITGLNDVTNKGYWLDIYFCDDGGTAGVDLIINSTSAYNCTMKYEVVNAGGKANAVLTASSRVIWYTRAGGVTQTCSYSNTRIQKETNTPVISAYTREINSFVFGAGYTSSANRMICTSGFYFNTTSTLKTITAIKLNPTASGRAYLGAKTKVYLFGRAV